MFGNDVITFCLGAAAVGFGYFLYLVASRGLPAALAWLKAKWNAGNADIAGLQGDVGDLAGKVMSLERGAIAELKAGLSAAQADISALKKGAAPMFLTPPAPGAQA